MSDVTTRDTQPSLLAFNAHQYSTFIKWHIHYVTAWTFLPSCLKKQAFLPLQRLHCFRQNMQYGLWNWVILVFVLRLRDTIHFFRRYASKQLSYFHPSDLLSFWVLTQNSSACYSVSPDVDNVSCEFECCMRFCLWVDGWHGTEGQTGCNA